MSKDKVKLPDDGSIQKALATCRSDEKGPNAYVVLGYSNPTTLTVIASGEGGLTEASVHLPSDDSRYVLLRKDHKVEMAKTVKFAFIDWTPTGLKPLRKALISTHKGQVQQMMKPFHVDYAASDQSDLDERIILGKIGMASGTSSQVTDKKATEKKVTAAPKPVNFNSPTSADGPSSPKQPVRNFTPMRSTQPRQSVTDDKKSDAMRAAGTTTIQFVDADAFKNALKTVRNDKEPTDWILANYPKKDTIGLIGSGSGGLNELLTKVEDDSVNFGLIRVTEQIDKSKTTKFVYLKWQPESVKPMKKAEIGTRQGAISALFQPYHVDTVISKKDEISQEQMMDMVSSASGSKSHVISRGSVHN